MRFAPSGLFFLGILLSIIILLGSTKVDCSKYDISIIACDSFPFKYTTKLTNRKENIQLFAYGEVGFLRNASLRMPLFLYNINMKKWIKIIYILIPISLPIHLGDILAY